MDRTRTSLTLPRTTTCIPLSTAQTTPGARLSNVSRVSRFLALCESRGQYSCITWLCTLLPPPPAPPRPATPEKFTVPHRCARFGPGGHLIQVLPNLPSDGQPALVDIHSMEVRLGFFVCSNVNIFTMSFIFKQLAWVLTHDNCRREIRLVLEKEPD